MENKSKRVFSTLAAMTTFCSSIFGESEEDKHYNRFDFEPVRMKGSAGVYNKNKHMSRKERMRKSKRNSRRK